VRIARRIHKDRLAELERGVDLNERIASQVSPVFAQLGWPVGRPIPQAEIDLARRRMKGGRP